MFVVGGYNSAVISIPDTIKMNDKMNARTLPEATINPMHFLCILWVFAMKVFKVFLPFRPDIFTGFS